MYQMQIEMYPAFQTIDLLCLGSPKYWERIRPTFTLREAASLIPTLISIVFHRQYYSSRWARKTWPGKFQIGLCWGSVNSGADATFSSIHHLLILGDDKGLQVAESLVFGFKGILATNGHLPPILCWLRCIQQFKKIVQMKFRKYSFVLVRWSSRETRKPTFVTAVGGW